MVAFKPHRSPNIQVQLCARIERSEFAIAGELTKRSPWFEPSLLTAIENGFALVERLLHYESHKFKGGLPRAAITTIHLTLL